MNKLYNKFTAISSNRSTMERKHYRRQTCNKLSLCASSHDASTVVRVDNKLDRQRVGYCWQHDRHAVAKFSLVQSLGQSSRKKYPYFWITRIFLFYTKDHKISGRSLPFQNQLDPSSRFYRAMLCIRGTSHGPVSVRLSVCPPQVGVLSKRLNESSWFLACELSSTRPTLC